VIAACAVHIPLSRVPTHVRVIRDGRRLAVPVRFLQAGDTVRVTRPAVLRFAYDGNRFRVTHGQLQLECRRLRIETRAGSEWVGVLAVELRSGRVYVRAGRRARRALVLSREMLAFATAAETTFVVGRDPVVKRTRAWTLNRTIVVALPSRQTLRINARMSYTALSDAHGLRLNVWPFSISPLQRQTTPADRLMPFWADGLPCSVGCTPPGATPGWPLKPFHQQHAIRAGINELRPANFHVAVDIQADNFQPVYALRSGYASIRYPGTGDVNVDVGGFYYWHIDPTVRTGQYVVAYKTEIGRVLNGFGHLALSEGTTSDYLNPLRPGGMLRPYSDTEPPIIGVPRVFPDGRVIVGAFDPQSSVHRQRYLTPVLAPSSLAWRLYDGHGRPITGLTWAMRGSQNYPPALRPVIFAPGASNPGFTCFYTRLICVPNWVYWLAGGLSGPLPLSRLRPGRYRLTVYAWDWAGNTSALDYGLRLPLARAAGGPGREFGPLAPRFDYP
jgi:hypothetical protein